MYSQEVGVGTVKKGATKMTMSSTDTERRKRAQSESAAVTLGESGAASEEWSYKTEQRQSSAFANEGYMRYVSVLTTVEKFSLNFLSCHFQSMLIFAILNHPCSLLVYSCFFGVCQPWVLLIQNTVNRSKLIRKKTEISE